MARSFTLFFYGATWSDLSPVLDNVASRVENLRWNYPEPYKPTLFLYEYDDLLNEFEEDDIDRLIAISGVNNFPTCILCLQLSGSSEHDPNKVYDDAEYLTRRLLQQFKGVADDEYCEMWTLEEILEGKEKQGGKFLDCYRENK